MPVAQDIRKNLTLNVDGRGYAGQLESFSAPKLTLQTEDYRAGGMDAPIKLTMGMEGLEASFSMHSYNREQLALFGVQEGAFLPITVREVLESWDGTITPVVHVMRGKFTEIDPGESKPGELAPIAYSVALSYYRMTHGGRVIHEIDVENMVRTINGTDVLAGQRAALGL